VGEELYDAGDGVTAVDGAFGSAHDFHLVDVFSGDAGEIHPAAGRIDGRAVNENLGEVGIAAVEKNRGRTAEGAGTADGDAG